ncbi:MAG: GTPase ObgE [Acidobacteria bacterium]|nr:GTPase ObgE [Acidobacteriota bacterium]
MERTFVDEARIEVRAGDGGNGATSFLREKYRPRGGPDGGNGGDGGSVILRVAGGVSTLGDVARHPHQRATRGTHGSGKERNGAAGADRIVSVPDGTVVLSESGEALADLVGEGTEFVAARGGRGGRGNAAFATARRRIPGFSERGEPGEERRLLLQLKLLADVGLVGFPNAGKSSLIARLSAARPEVAAYPFTTLSPHLGVAEASGVRYVVADVPGLIEGASGGRGLGLAFLRHLERCLVLCFVLDLAASDAAAGDPAAGDPGAALEALRAELRAYREGFDERPGIVAANKIDLPEGRASLEDARASAERAGFGFRPVSALTGEGTEALAVSLGEKVAEARAALPPACSHALITIRPEERTVAVEPEDGAWRVRSAAAERLVRRLDIANPDAVAYMQDRLAGLGVEAALERAGALERDEVRIGDATFEFFPERGAVQDPSGPRAPRSNEGVRGAETAPAPVGRGPSGRRAPRSKGGSR